MKFRQLDKNGDWVFGLGLQSYALAQDAVRLSIQTRLSMFENDCFFSPTGWIDWFNLLGASNETALLFAITTIINTTEGVNNITQFSTFLDRNTRVLTCQYTVTTTFGTQVIGVASFSPAPYSGLSKFASDIYFNGTESSVNVDTGLYIPDATSAIWMVYDESNGYDLVVGAVTVIGPSTVQLNINPAPPAGFFRLLGLS